MVHSWANIPAEQARLWWAGWAQAPVVLDGRAVSNVIRRRVPVAVAMRSRVLVDGRARPLSRRAITDWVVWLFALNGTCGLCAPHFSIVHNGTCNLCAPHCWIAHNGTCSLCAPAAGELSLGDSGFRAGLDDGRGNPECGAKALWTYIHEGVSSVPNPLTLNCD